MKEFIWNKEDNSPSIKINLEEFDDTSLDKELNKLFGKQSVESKVYQNIERTYLKYLFEKGNTNIIIITNKVPEQILILPMTSSTTIFMTGSVRSWIHFLAIRDEEHAQKEIQLISKEIKKIFKKELPIISNVLDYE